MSDDTTMPVDVEETEAPMETPVEGAPEVGEETEAEDAAPVAAPAEEEEAA